MENSKLKSLTKEAEYLTLQEVEDYLGITRRSVDNIVKKFKSLDKNSTTQYPYIKYNGGIRLNKHYLNLHKKTNKIKFTQNGKNLTILGKDVWVWLQKNKWTDDRVARITKKKYLIFLTSFFSQIRRKIIKENLIFNLPYKLGSIYIRKNISHRYKRKIKKHLTRQNKIEFYANRHTFGHSFSIVWDKSTAHLIKPGILTFSGLPIFKTELRDHIIELSENNQSPSFNSHLGDQTRETL